MIPGSSGTPSAVLNWAMLGNAVTLGHGACGLGAARPLARPGSRQVVHAPNDGYRLMRLERDAGQSVPQTGERYPAAIDQYDPSVRTLQRGQYLKARAPLVAAIIEQKLAARVQVARPR